MNNIFRVGAEVFEESQIGYVTHITKLSNIILNSRNSISITGLKQYGKTSLVKEVLDRVKNESSEKIISIFVNLAKQQSYSLLLSTIIETLHKEVKKINEIVNNTEYMEYRNELSALEINSREYRDTIEFLFQWLKSENYRVIMTIDEFDIAGDLFKETADYEFLRGLSSNRDILITLLLISRRQVYMIEKKNFNNSTFHGALQTYPVRGFEEEEYDALYDVLKRRYNIDLPEFSKTRLQFYCGSSPYLVSLFAYDFVTEHLTNNTISIDEIYLNRASDISKYYESIYNCLERDEIIIENERKEISTIEKLFGIIFGPKVSVIEEDIKVLEQLGYLYYKGEKYYSISEHFTLELRRKPLKVDTWNAILDVDKKIKVMIRSQIMQNLSIDYIDYDIWLSIFEKISIDQKQLDTLDRFIDTSMETYHNDVDYLDVCSLKIAVKMLQFDWDEFSCYFDNETWSEWGKKLELCSSARNPIAHGQKDSLSPEEIACVNTYCAEIIKVLVKNNACLNIDDKINKSQNIKKREIRLAYYDKNYASANNSLLHETVRMTAATQNSRAIRGFFIFNNKYYKCSIKNKKWKDKYPKMSLSEHLGNEYNIKIMSINIDKNFIIVSLV